MWELNKTTLVIGRNELKYFIKFTDDVLKLNALIL